MTLSDVPENPAVGQLTGLHLRVTHSPWPLAVAHREAIARHWTRRTAENPAFFNGQVYVLRRLEWIGDRAHGLMSLEQFAAFLYWRDNPGLDTDTLDGFASALVRSCEGHVLLGRHITGTLNAGLLALPGGFLDARDTMDGDTIDVEQAAGRELAEETGLDTETLRRAPGFLIARQGRACCMAVEYRSSLTADALTQRARAGLERQGAAELTDVTFIRNPQDLAGQPVPEHARLLVSHVLATSS